MVTIFLVLNAPPRHSFCPPSFLSMLLVICGPAHESEVIDAHADQIRNRHHGRWEPSKASS